MKLSLLDFKKLENFPSASGIEFYDDRIYVVGDDAKDLLVLNKKWNKPGFIHLFDSEEARISKTQKADLEASAVIHLNKKPYLLLLGSGSTEIRNQAVLLNLLNYKFEMLDLSIFYDRLKKSGIAELNIEGASAMNGELVLSNRANKTNPDNILIVTSIDFWKKQADAPIHLIKVGLPTTEPVMGISGITYSEHQEMLIFTTSTEDTMNAYDDGTIGKSCLGFIENAYRKIGREKVQLKVNEIIDLPSADEQFKGYKIESVCIQSEKDHSMKLQMVADNDSETSYLFKVQVKLI
jgi:hypothetical protein